MANFKIILAGVALLLMILLITPYQFGRGIMSDKGEVRILSPSVSADNGAIAINGNENHVSMEKAVEGDVPARAIPSECGGFVPCNGIETWSMLGLTIILSVVATLASQQVIRKYEDERMFWEDDNVKSH